MNPLVMWLARIFSAVLVFAIYRIWGFAGVGAAVSLALVWYVYHRVRYGVWPD